MGRSVRSLDWGCPAPVERLKGKAKKQYPGQLRLQSYDFLLDLGFFVGISIKSGETIGRKWGF